MKKWHERCRVASALAERLEGGRYINVEINREKAARYGMTVADVQLFVTSAVGGAMVGETVEGIARYPINLRYPQSWRDSPQALRQLPILTPMGSKSPRQTWPTLKSLPDRRC